MTLKFNGETLKNLNTKFSNSAANLQSHWPLSLLKMSANIIMDHPPRPLPPQSANGGSLQKIDAGIGGRQRVIAVDTTSIPVPRTRMSLARNSATVEKVTYTWTNINVDTADTKIKVPKTNIRLLNKTEPPRKHILHNVSGILRPGEMVAVLGSSGAGKSTLLDVLAFRNSHKLKVSGIRAINGVPIEENTITASSAYVQQMDLFIGVLTPRESLIFQAQVRMHKHIPYEDRLEIVEEVIREFGLTKCADTQIGTKWFKGISGGEMKRLSIATEFLTDPSLILLDEPTSGLDSNTAQHVISILKTLASKNKTVICTVHQPSSQLFALFDKVMLMAEGRIAYLGAADAALQFFSNLGYTCPIMFNPADFLIDILAIKTGKEAESREIVTRICQTFYETHMASTDLKVLSEQNMVGVTKPKKMSPYKASVFSQYKAVLKRSWISFARDPMIFRVRVAQTIFLGFFIGAIFYDLNLKTFEGVQNLNGAMFMILCSLSYQHMLAALDNFCSELPVFLREHFNGMYRADVYFFSKLIVELPFYILLPLIFQGICYFMMGFDPTLSSFFKTLLVMVLITAICGGIGCFLSCLAKDITVALLLAPPIIFPFFLFSGFLLRPGTGPIYLVWLEYISWYFYGYEAMAIVQMEHLEGIHCYGICPETGIEVLRTLGFNKNNYWKDVIALSVLAAAAQILAFMGLLARTFRK